MFLKGAHFKEIKWSQYYTRLQFPVCLYFQTYYKEKERGGTVVCVYNGQGLLSGCFPLNTLKIW